MVFTAIVIGICVPLFAYWLSATARLIAEQRSMSDSGNRPKTDVPPILLTICA
jgi:hypothetical protein